MSDNTINEIAKASPDMHKERIEQLKALLPDLFDGEGQLDETALRALISNEADDAAQRFSFEWAGKQKSKRLAYTPSRASLAYDPTRSLNHDGTENKKGQTAEQNTSENLIIEGDNLEVLKLLQTTYFEQVKCIYIDPPYNTGKDFIYPDNFTEGKKAYWEKNGEVKEGVKLTALPETHGRRHSDWLNFMQSRLLLARQMLREDGAIFISIGNDEEHHLRTLCDSIFGSENFIEKIVWNKRIPKNDAGIGNVHEYILLYAKCATEKTMFLMRKDGLQDVYDFVLELKNKNIAISDAEKELKKYYTKKGYDRGITLYNRLDENYNLWGKINLNWPNTSTTGSKYEVLHPKTNKPVNIPDRGWRWKKDTFKNKINASELQVLHDGSIRKGLIWFASDENTQPSGITYLKDVENMLLRSFISLKSDGGVTLERLLGQTIFSNPKPVNFISLLIQSFMGNDDIILDFFAGSGTSAHAVMKQNAEDNGNRKHILVQIPEITDEKSEAYKSGYKKISDITIERVKRAGAKIREENPDAKIDTGFRVFKLTHSNFAENLFTPDEDKSDAENMKALETHLTEATQTRLFNADEFNNLVTEISLKNGFGLFYQLEAMTDFKHNKIYRLHGNGKSALLCLDNSLHDNSVENLKTFKEEQLIVSSSALDTSKKFSLKTKFKGNLRVF